jgi:thiol-disulfide isomerase/thioredoxin
VSEPGAAKRDPFQLFLIVACVALCGLVIALAVQNRSLKGRVAQLETAVSTSGVPADVLKSGDALPPFDLVAVSGEKIRLPFDGSGTRTLLLVFSSTCPACQETFPAWNRLLADGTPEGVRVVGVQTDLAGGAAAEVATFPVYGFDGSRPEGFSKIPYIPCAAVLDAKGKVEYVAFGVPDDGKVAELRQAVGL